MIISDIMATEFKLYFLTDDKNKNKNDKSNF